MGIEPFTRDNTIFKDESVLRDEYQPKELLERDDELNSYQNALRPVINGAPPKNIFLYGQTGVGKTLSTELLLERLVQDQEHYDDLSIDTIYLNCQDLTSSYQVAANLVNRFRERDPTKDPIPTTGYPTGMIYDMLWSCIEETQATHVIIVLDEIDSIGEDDGLLYQLPRANNNAHVDNTYVGVIGICNNFTFRDNLSARVKDTLCEEELHFPPYDANELRNILQQRAVKAFQPGVLDDDVIPLCAAFAAQESGSARQALKLLYKSGDISRERDETAVCEAFVREARDRIINGRIRDELNSLPTQSKLTLLALYRLASAKQTPAKRAEIFRVYQNVAREVGADIVSIRSIHDRLSELTLKGFIEVEERNEGRVGGSYYLYDFGGHMNVIGEALKNDNRL